jgi:Chaperone of endosialidase
MSMGGGSSGGAGAQKLYFRNASKEFPTIENWITKMTGTDFPNFVAQDPIWSGLYNRAARYGASGPSPILSELQGQGLDYLQQGPSDISQALTKLGLSQVNRRPSNISRIMQTQAQADLLNRGALTPALNRDVRNDTLATAGAMGMGYTPGTLGTELLNREKYREGREQLAHQYAGQAEAASQADLTSRLTAGAAGEQAGIQDMASRFGIAGGVQGQTMQDIAQHYQIPQQVAQGAAQTFQGFANPILSYLNSAFTPTVYGQGSGDSTMSDIGKLAGTIIGAVATAYSDERLKENITDTGLQTRDGIPIKDFNFTGDHRRFRGVIAQEVERIRPEAVVTDPGTGFKMVHYGQIGAPLIELNTKE